MIAEEEFINAVGRYQQDPFKDMFEIKFFTNYIIAYTCINLKYRFMSHTLDNLDDIHIQRGWYELAAGIINIVLGLLIGLKYHGRRSHLLYFILIVLAISDSVLHALRYFMHE